MITVMTTSSRLKLQTYDGYLDELLATDADFRTHWDAEILARTFGLAVLKYRTEHGLTQTTLGKTLGIPQSQIARIEDGEHTPSLPTMVKVCDVLGLELTLTISPKGEARREISKTLQRGVCDATDQVIVSVREAR